MKRPEQPPKAELPEQEGSPGLLASPICTVGPSPSALAAICPDLVHSQPLTKSPMAAAQLDNADWLPTEGGGQRQRPDRLFAPNHIAHGVCGPLTVFDVVSAQLQSPASLHLHSPLALPQTAMVKNRTRPPPPYSAQIVGGQESQKCQMCSANSLGKQPPSMVKKEGQISWIKLPFRECPTLWAMAAPRALLNLPLGRAKKARQKVFGPVERVSMGKTQSSVQMTSSLAIWSSR